MPPRSTAPAKNKGSVVEAGVAGGTFGLLIAFLADSVSADYPSISRFLSIINPVITVTISGIWLFVKSVYIDPYIAMKKHQASHEYIKYLLDDAKETEKAILSNPDTSEEHKAEIRKTVEELERKLMNSIIEHVELISKE